MWDAFYKQHSIVRQNLGLTRGLMRSCQMVLSSAKDIDNLKVLQCSMQFIFTNFVQVHDYWKPFTLVRLVKIKIDVISEVRILSMAVFKINFLSRSWSCWRIFTIMRQEINYILVFRSQNESGEDKSLNTKVISWHWRPKETHGQDMDRRNR